MSKKKKKKKITKKSTKRSSAKKKKSSGKSPSISKEDLIAKNMDFCENLVWKLVSSLNLPTNQIDDFISAGYMGLIEAAERFDPKQKASFKTFAYARIRGAVIDFIRTETSLRGINFRKIKAMEALDTLVEDMAEAQLEYQQASNGQPLSDDAKLAGILQLAANGAMAIQLNYADLEDDLTEEEKGFEAIEKKQFQDIIKKILNEHLNEKERLIIEKFYFEDKSFVEIAQEHQDISRSWISRLHTKALEKIKMKLKQHYAEDI